MVVLMSFGPRSLVLKRPKGTKWPDIKILIVEIGIFASRAKAPKKSSF